MSIHTKRSFISSCSCLTQNVFLSRSLRFGNSRVWSRHHWRMLLHPCNTSSLCSVNFLLMSLSHALSQHSVTRTNNFLSRTRPQPVRTALRVPTTRARWPSQRRTLVEPHYDIWFLQTQFFFFRKWQSIHCVFRFGSYHCQISAFLGEQALVFPQLWHQLSNLGS